MSGRPTPLIRIEAPARLHLGFLDLHGGLGRRFGSLGLAIDAFTTRIEAAPAPDFSATGPGAARALAWARGYAAARGLRGGARLHIGDAIPEHAGLGSGTQLALAVGTALERLLGPGRGSDNDNDRGADHGTETGRGPRPATGRPDGRAVARLIGRGARSGIGIGAFEQGGFLCDGGSPTEPGEPPPLLIRLPFPATWRVLLLLDPAHQGLYGDGERRAFAGLPPFPAETAGHLCRLLLMQLAPALAEGRFAAAAVALGEIQRAVGTHFAPAQGGCYTSPAVAAALDWAGAAGYAGRGQSSWGPTGFVLVPDADEALRLREALRGRRAAHSPLDYRITAGRNRGARIEALHVPGAAP